MAVLGVTWKPDAAVGRAWGWQLLPLLLTQAGWVLQG